MKYLRGVCIGTIIATLMIIVLAIVQSKRNTHTMLIVIFLMLITVFLVLILKQVFNPIIHVIDESAKKLQINGKGNEKDYCKELNSLKLEENISFLMKKLGKMELEKYIKEAVDNKAAYEALQSQINPHFLYNILETIRGQALLEDDAKTATMIENLSSFFRYSISQKGSIVTLRDEIENIENYMTIQKYRFRDRFSMEIIITEENQIALDYQVPRLILQPIVENIIVHAFKDVRRGGLIRVEIELLEDLIIRIRDNGIGMNTDTLLELNEKINRDRMELNGQQKLGNGIALQNINIRIKMLYGDEYGLNIFSLLNSGTMVEIILPGKKGKEDLEKNSIEVSKFEF